MKRIGLFIVVIIFAGSTLSSCATIRSIFQTQYYSYDSFRISVANYDRVTAPSEGTFATVSTYYESLKNHSVEHLESGTIARHELRKFLTERDLPNVSGNISFLESVGNNVFTFYSDDENYYVILYCEKDEKE